MALDRAGPGVGVPGEAGSTTPGHRETRFLSLATSFTIESKAQLKAWLSRGRP
jgi:hypothetical protein